MTDSRFFSVQVKVESFCGIRFLARRPHHNSGGDSLDILIHGNYDEPSN